MVKGAAVGAGALSAGRLLADPPAATASGGLTKGDAAILRFLAAAEIVEADIWQQCNELAGIQDSEVPGGTGNPAYQRRSSSIVSSRSSRSSARPRPTAPRRPPPAAWSLTGFIGQSAEFFAFVTGLAKAADAARHGT